MSEPTYSTTPCPFCGGRVIVTNVHRCEGCGRALVCAEVWSRVVGYIRPTQNFNKAQRQMFLDRRYWDGNEAARRIAKMKGGK